MVKNLGKKMTMKIMKMQLKNLICNQLWIVVEHLPTWLLK